MKLSVLISLYKEEKVEYFEKSMQSIWDNQTRRPDEIILVIDGPLTAILHDSVQQWKIKLNDYLVIVELKENNGLAKALNAGIRYCKGKYIARMDTDDICVANRFELQELFLDTHSDIFLVGSGMMEIDEEDNLINERIMPLNHHEIVQTISKTTPFVHSSVMFRKQIFLDGVLYSNKCKRFQDIELWFRIISAGYKVANMSDIFLKFRKSTMLYRRRREFAFTEFHIFMKGIYMLNGLFSLQYIYPIIHLLFRFLPASMCLFIYRHFIAKYWDITTIKSSLK
jgi:glycosyltransferase involved in cell wall biosynthesis